MTDFLNIDGSTSHFFANAKVSKTMRPYDHGTAKYRAISNMLVGPKKLIKIRHYKGADGSTRRTIEIEI